MKRSFKFLAMALCLGAAMTLQSCKQEPLKFRDEGAHCLRESPRVTVYFVPLDGVSRLEARMAGKAFLNNFGENRKGEYHVALLNNIVSPDSCLNDAKTRLSAKRMLKWLNAAYAGHVPTKEDDYQKYYIIGVTNRDISTDIHGSKDYGILGLSYLGRGKATIISTYRLKRKKDLWKLAAHEFCHGFYGCPHCPYDDPHCIMADAKGGNPHFELKQSLCPTCDAKCR